MMHGDRSRDPPPYHPGWGGLTRKLVLEENTFSRIAWSSKLGPCARRGCCQGRHPAPEVSGSLGMAQACTEPGRLIYGKSCFTRRCLSAKYLLACACPREHVAKSFASVARIPCRGYPASLEGTVGQEGGVTAGGPPRATCGVEGRAVNNGAVYADYAASSPGLSSLHTAELWR